MVYCAKNVKSESPKPVYRAVCASPWKVPQQRKSFFDSQDIFPEPKPPVSINGEIEKRLKMRGIDKPSKDLETLKQILEALRLKGLLHSKKASEPISHRNFVYERSFSSDESPIVIMKPSINGRFANESPPPSFRNTAGVRRNLGNSGEVQPSASPLRERPEIDRNARHQARPGNSVSPSRNETSTKNPSSLVRKRVPLSVETLSKADKLPEQRRASPIHSPRLSPKRTGPGQIISNGLPRNRKPTAVIEPKLEDESSSVSESSFSTSSQTDNERSNMEEYKGGRSLLERCDKLLHSIMEMTATESQPSPVSVLDSSFYKDESSSPSPVMKRSLYFKDPPEEKIWRSAISPMQAKRNDESDDYHFVYISDILRATRYLPEESNVFLLLEKQQHLKGKDTSKSSRLQRKLIFDTITKILQRNRQLPPWKAISWSNTRHSLCQIWSEFQKIRERDTAEKDLFDVICGVLRKDLAGDAIRGWGDCPEEISDAVFHIERLVIKDLIGETIRDLAGNCVVPARRRKLVF